MKKTLFSLLICSFTAFAQQQEKMVVAPVGIQQNSASTWIGSQLFYNLDGSTLDNVVGAAKIKINTVKRLENSNFNLNVIGNISKFSGAVDRENIDRDLREISQSEQGLAIGLEPLYKIIDLNEIKLQAYGGLMYKLNHFQNINAEGDDVGLSQGRFSLGLQIEALQFSDGGGLLHLSIEGGSSIFVDQDKYAQVFNENRSSLAFVESTFILPLFGQFGLLAKYVITEDIKPVFGAGIIIKN